MKGLEPKFCFPMEFDGNEADEVNKAQYRIGFVHGENTERIRYHLEWRNNGFRSLTEDIAS